MLCHVMARARNYSNEAVKVYILLFVVVDIALPLTTTATDPGLTGQNDG